MITDDVFQTVEQSVGRSLLIPPGASAECTERIIAEDTPARECPHDDFGLRPRTGTIGISEDGVPIRNIESPYGGGVRSLPGATGNCLPVMFPTAPVPSANGPQLGSWRVAVVRVEETPAGCWKCSSSVAGWGSPPSWFSELCWPRWPVFTCGEDTGTVRAYGLYTD